MRKVAYYTTTEFPDERIYPHPQPIEVGIGFTQLRGGNLWVEYFDGSCARVLEWRVDGENLLFPDDRGLVCGKVFYEDWNPDNDGVDHVNVYSKGKTWAGRQLTNFARTPFTHPEDGPFDSVEGYWYWLGCKDDKLRKLSGFAAKKYGREVGAPDWMSDDEFKRKIRLAIEAKLKAYPEILEKLPRHLPLTHYYVFGRKVVNVPEADWILKIIEDYAAQETRLD